MRQETGDRDFVPWVAPIAARLRESRQEVARLAGDFPESAWEDLSEVPGWTYRGILAHLAEGDVFVQMVLRAVIEDSDTDLRLQSSVRETRTAGIIARGRERSIGELIGDIQREGEETQTLLAWLLSEHESVSVITSNRNPTPVSAGDFLRAFRHDEEHIAHLRRAVEVRS